MGGGRRLMLRNVMRVMAIQGSKSPNIGDLENGGPYPTGLAAELELVAQGSSSFSRITVIVAADGLVSLLAANCVHLTAVSTWLPQQWP